MAFQFRLDVDDDEVQKTMDRMSSINLRSQNQDSIMRRAKSSMTQIPKLVGVATQFPQIDGKFEVPHMDKVFERHDKMNAFTPVPPIIRNQQQKAIWKMVKKFSNRYHHLWILVCQPKHEAIAPFMEIFKQQMQLNVNKHLQNLIPSEDYQKSRIFTRQGLDIKLMMDYITYEKYVANQMKQFENDTKIMEIYVESSKKTGRGVLPSKKIKNSSRLVDFIENQVKQDMQRSRKNIPYFNFIHTNSGPELFNRRAIIKSCLCIRPQAQMIQNHSNFVKLLEKQTADNREKALKQLKKYNNDEKKDIFGKANHINDKYNAFEKINAGFSFSFDEYLRKYYPLDQFSQFQKKEVYNWVISRYCIESSIYPFINNTIRYSLNSERVKPISTFVKYLFDAIRFYFTTRYREITFKTVYRGSRISLIEQRSFVEGRYLWNLGFTSTSRSKKVAEWFLSSTNDYTQSYEKVLMVIRLPPLTNQLQYLWDQEGFYSMDKIPEIKDWVLSEEQVLFNPLNVFKILQWNKDTKILELQYAPQLQIIEKKKEGIPLTQQEQELLRSISKLKDTDFDKGQQLLQEGDPSSAVKYYEQSDQTGTQLSFTQKSNYIRGLMEVGSLSKMEGLLKQSIEQEQNAEKQLLATDASYASTTISKLADSVQSLTLYQQSTDFQAANSKAQQTKSLTIQKSMQFPNQQTLLLQTKAYIELAKIKYEVSQTLDSIKESIRSLKIIDQMADVNLCFRLHQLGNQLKKIPHLKVMPDMINLKYILDEKKYLNANILLLKQETLRKIDEIRYSKLSQQEEYQGLTSSNKQPIYKNQFGSSSVCKEDHKKAQQLLHKYFTKRDTRIESQLLEEKFVLAYWQVERARIQKQGISEKQQIQERELLKVCRQNLFQIKNSYKQLFEHEIEAYQVLYRNIYKTSIDVSSCLKSYHKNLYQRYQNFINVQRKYEGNSAEVARIYWRHGQILFQYGQIIERPLLMDPTQITSSQKLGHKKIQQAQSVIKSIEERQSTIVGNNKKQFTHQKSQINRTITKYFKSKSIQRVQARKLSIIKTQDETMKSTLSLDNINKSNFFSRLISTIDSNKQLHESDLYINQSLFKIKDACEKIQVLNDSSSVLVPNQSYNQRLRSCKSQFDNVVSTIQKYKEKRLLERNVNMAHLYLLMAQNQFRLGLIQNSQDYLKHSNSCLSKALKIDQKRKQVVIKKLNKEKLLLGNATKIGCLRLESYIVAFFGKKQKKKQLLENLRRAKSTMFQKMNEPLHQADINQSIGLVASNLLLVYRQVGFSDVRDPFLEAIKIRNNLLGPYNKLSARDYTLLVQMISVPEVKNKYSNEIATYYKKAQQIYDRVDCSTDSLLILYRMQLQSTYNIFSLKQDEACKTIKYYLKCFDDCQNKQISLQIASQLYRSSWYLSQQPGYQKQGLQELKKSYSYIDDLQKYVNKTYNLTDNDRRKKALTKLKVENLRKIVEAQQTQKDTEAKIYFDLLNQQQEKLSKNSTVK